MTALVVLATSSIVYFGLQRALEYHLDDILDERAGIVVRAAAGQPDLAHLARELNARGLRVTLTSADGDTYDVDAEVARVGTNLPSPTPSGAASLRTRAVGLPNGAAAEVAVSREGVDRALRRLLALELTTAVFGLTAVAVLLMCTTRSALSPLDGWVTAANDIANGNRTRRLHPDRADTELGAAATAFDGMLDRLEQAIATATDAQRTTRDFLDAAAHQLRTPIAGAATAIQAHLRLHPNVADAQLLHIVDRETRRAGQIVHRLLRLAQLDHGLRLHPATIDLHSLVVEEVERIARRAPHLQVRLPAEESLLVHADPEATAEILANLLDNAARYATSRIDITTATTIDRVAVRVADDGSGIPSEYREWIFERFTTLDDRSDTGLGLAIARELARTQHGELVHSGAFELTLPLAQTQSKASEPRTADSRKSPVIRP